MRTEKLPLNAGVALPPAPALLHSEEFMILKSASYRDDCPAFALQYIATVNKIEVDSTQFTS